MGKNHRHSKKLKSEKNKVHIKTKTKFLPKGQNVTNTAFKIRSIVLQDQLKDKDVLGGFSRKEVNIDELITKLRHYNDTIKTESCQELKELIAQRPLEATQKYLSSIIQNCSGLVQDKERKVRRASIKLQNAIFEKVSLVTLRPLFNYILTNLKCAMTNINKNIQEDSLLLLDALLEHKSLLISENFDAIFPNFLMLISKLKSHSSAERSLSLNLEGKVTSVKWRVKVLTRLYGILDAIIQSRDIDKEANGDDANTITLYANGARIIPLYKDISMFESIDFSFLSNKDSNVAKFDTHILNLVQLLHEIWMEVVPEKGSKKNEPEPTSLPNQESVAVFGCIVHILRLLYEYVQISQNTEILSQNKSTLFLDHLIRNFPYTHNKKNLHEISKEFSSCYTLTQDQNCTQENLIVIYIFLTVRLRNIKNSPKYCKTIAPYLNSCLKAQSRLSPLSITYLVKILKEIFLKPPYLCRKLGINETEMMENVGSFYNSVKTPPSSESDILEILTHSSVQSWTEKLPTYLCSNKVSAKLIDTVLDLCKRDVKTVQDGVQNALKLILDNLNNLEITDSSDVRRAQMNLVSIFFYLPNLSPDDVTTIEHFIELHPDLEYSTHFQNVLGLRSHMNK